MPTDEKISNEHITDYLKKMNEQEVFNCILAFRGSITTSALNCIDENKSFITFELFQISELQFNITKHQYVPAHAVMNEKEKKALLTKYRLKDLQLPKILNQDPVARYYGVKKG